MILTFGKFLQMITAALFCMVFTYCTWYEGSEILDRPWEWKYSTHFTPVNDDQAMDADDISSFDYFVYAAKFKPLFPFLMVITAFYLIILTGFILFKRSIKKWLYSYWDWVSFFCFQVVLYPIPRLLEGISSKHFF